MARIAFALIALAIAAPAHADAIEQIIKSDAAIVAAEKAAEAAYNKTCAKITFANGAKACVRSYGDRR